MKLDFDICKGGRLNRRKIIGMRYNGMDIYSLIGVYNAYTIEVTEEGEKTVYFDISSDYYHSDIDTYFNMGNGTISNNNISSYTYTEPGTYLIITSARISRAGSGSPRVIAVNGIRRDTISLDNAFNHYIYVREFAPQNLKTRRVTSMKNMFRDCWHNPNEVLQYTEEAFGAENRTSVHYILIDSNKFDTSKVTNMSGMFSAPELPSGYRCTFAPSSIFNTSNVTNMSGMFYKYNCDYNIDFSAWDTSSATDMSEMFYGSEYVYILDISNFNTENVTTFRDMFRDSSLYCKYLYYDENNKRIDIPLDFSKWNTSSATDMSGMFCNCARLTSLDLSDWDISNVIDMSNMFYDSYKLGSLDLSWWNINNAANIDNMLGFCNGLYELRLDNCGYDTISKIINEANIPTDTVKVNGEYVTRKLHCQRANAQGLESSLPYGWEFSYID